MTQKEQESVDKLVQLVQLLREENATFRKDVSLQVESINSKTDKKHLPIHLESDILGHVQKAVNESIKNALSGYNSPVIKLVNEVVSEHNSELKTIISDSFNEVIKKEDFKKSVVDAFSHKVSRSIISNNDGLFDKVANELKQDAVFKAKMAIAVSNVVNECLEIKK